MWTSHGRVVALRLQVGARQFYWLAHPDDPELRQLLDAWSDRGCCAFLVVDDRMANFAALNYRPLALAPSMHVFNCTDVDTAQLVDAALHLATSGAVARQAISDVLGIPALEHVDVSILAKAAVPRVRSLALMAPASPRRH